MPGVDASEFWQRRAHRRRPNLEGAAKEKRRPAKAGRRRDFA
jgi:hypothetical protein